jgi:ERI1 exoribonuclease 2
VSEIQIYVRPERSNLSAFCQKLTGITQAQVDAGVPLHSAIDQYRRWLVEHRLLPSGAAPEVATAVHRTEYRAAQGWPRFAILMWSDADLAGQLFGECERKGLHGRRAWWLRQWVNLKPLYSSHYCREARGGLQACVEATGQKFEGRAHSGLVDARNTAKIVSNMRAEGYRFVRTTRACDIHTGIPYGHHSTSSHPLRKRLRVAK